MERSHTIFVADLHLGGPCNVEVLLHFLRNASYEKLIIGGDLIEDGATITKREMEVLEYLSENRERIIVIDGNHDPVEKGVVQALLGVKVLKNYRWKINGKEFCALHGPQFHVASFIFNIWFIDKLFGWFIWLCKKCYGLRRLVRFLHNKFSWSIARKAIEYAKKRKALKRFKTKVVEYAKRRKRLKRFKRLQRFEASKEKEYIVIFCGHTHEALHVVAYHKGKRIDYFNSGGFLVDDICSFVAVDYDGNASIHSIDHLGQITTPIKAQDA